MEIDSPLAKFFSIPKHPLAAIQSVLLWVFLSGLLGQFLDWFSPYMSGQGIVVLIPVLSLIGLGGWVGYSLPEMRVEIVFRAIAGLIGLILGVH